MALCFRMKGAEWLGTAMLVEVADRTIAEAMMADGPYAQVGLYEEVEIHDWRFGGRPEERRVRAKMTRAAVRSAAGPAASMAVALQVPLSPAFTRSGHVPCSGVASNSTR